MHQNRAKEFVQMYVTENDTERLKNSQVYSTENEQETYKRIAWKI